MEKICQKCGKPLKKIRDLNEEELKNLYYLNAKETSLWQVSNTLMLQPINNKIKRAYIRVFKLIAKVKLAKAQFSNKLLNNPDWFIMDGSIYTHEENI